MKQCFIVCPQVPLSMIGPFQTVWGACFIFSYPLFNTGSLLFCMKLAHNYKEMWLLVSNRNSGSIHPDLDINSSKVSKYSPKYCTDVWNMKVWNRSDSGKIARRFPYSKQSDVWGVEWSRKRFPASKNIRYLEPIAKCMHRRSLENSKYRHRRKVTSYILLFFTSLTISTKSKKHGNILKTSSQ